MPTIFPGAFPNPDPQSYVTQETGKRPVVFDILGPDLETSILPGNLKLVLHVNPNSMSFSYSKVVNRIQTKGGFVEQHFGDGTQTISFDMSTGGFMRVYTGMSAITGGGSYNAGGTRRQTIAYDKYLDLLALYEQNGAVYDITGQIVLHGIVKVTFDGTTWFGWFQSFSVTEAAETPYQFNLSAEFVVSHEIMGLRTVVNNTAALLNRNGVSSAAPPAVVDSSLSAVAQGALAGAAAGEATSDGASEDLPPSRREAALQEALGEGDDAGVFGAGLERLGQVNLFDGGPSLFGADDG